MGKCLAVYPLRFPPTQSRRNCSRVGSHYRTPPAVIWWKSCATYATPRANDVNPKLFVLCGRRDSRCAPEVKLTPTIGPCDHPIPRRVSCRLG